MPAKERIVVEDDIYGRETVIREAAPSTELAEWRGTGAERGAYEAILSACHIPDEALRAGRFSSAEALRSAFPEYIPPSKKAA